MALMKLITVVVAEEEWGQCVRVKEEEKAIAALEGGGKKKKRKESYKCSSWDTQTNKQTL